MKPFHKIVRSRVRMWCEKDGFSYILIEMEILCSGQKLASRKFSINALNENQSIE